MFMYNMTLGELWSLEAFLEKVIQLEWFGIPTNFDELGIDWITDYGSSWMEIISNSFCASKTVLVSSLFL